MVKALLLALFLFITPATAADLPDDYICHPASPTDIKMGNLGNSIWSYWWCRNPNKVWVVFQTWTAVDLQNFHYTQAKAFAARPFKVFLNTYRWGPPMVIPPTTTDPYRPLYDAVVAATSTDPTRPAPGPSFVGIPESPEIWVVTPNGANPTRKTSKVVNGVVQAYGSGTQTVKIGLPCDHTKTSYPLGTLTKYLPLYDNAGNITDEVISCIRIQ